MTAWNRGSDAIAFEGVLQGGERRLFLAECIVNHGLVEGGVATVWRTSMLGTSGANQIFASCRGRCVCTAARV